LAWKEVVELLMYLNLKLSHRVAPALAVGLNMHHHLRKEDSEQGLVQNVVEDSFAQVHREEDEYEFKQCYFGFLNLQTCYNRLKSGFVSGDYIVHKRED